MRRPVVGLFWNTLRERLDAESQVEFPSPAFRQVESFPDGVFQIGLRDGNLQAHRFNCRPICHPILGDVLGLVGSVFCVHGICFFSAVSLPVLLIEGDAAKRAVASSMG